MAGAVITGWTQDRIGRKWTLTTASLICSVSVAICYISDLPATPNTKRGVYFLAKTVQGFSIGGIMTSTQTWLSEVLPTELRGPFMAVFPIFKLLGYMQTVTGRPHVAMLTSIQTTCWRRGGAGGQ